MSPVRKNVQLVYVAFLPNAYFLSRWQRKRRIEEECPSAFLNEALFLFLRLVSHALSLPLSFAVISPKLARSLSEASVDLGSAEGFK